MRIFTTFLFCFVFTFSYSQKKEKLKTIWVEFTNKTTTEYSLEQPERFLSERALQRRSKQDIALDSTDLPVHSAYLDSLVQLGAEIHNVSKWLNAASIKIPDSLITQINDLSFVLSTRYVGKSLNAFKFIRRQNRQRDSLPKVFLLDNYYGHAEQQIRMLKGDFLHENGFLGAGKWVAVLDGGFSNIDIMPFFDSLRSHNLLRYHRDFVEGDDFVFESSSHGTEVLSTMAANYPRLMVGTAPQAIYTCLKTEDTNGEYLIEECNWVAAMEYADSLGVDVVNSSLGYTTFSDTSMNYQYEKLDGKTGIATRAAQLAAQKGMIVVSSAGNEGNNSWKYIDVPADAQNILSVGAVDRNLERAGFSSIGPSADGRIKPEIVALGQGVAVASVYGTKVNRSRGTSFSSPIIAGLVAALWQAFPERSNQEIIQAILQSASQTDTPDNELGYGIPDFQLAFQLLKMKE